MQLGTPRRQRYAEPLFDTSVRQRGVVRTRGERVELSRRDRNDRRPLTDEMGTESINDGFGDLDTTALAATAKMIDAPIAGIQDNFFIVDGGANESSRRDGE